MGKEKVKPFFTEDEAPPWAWEEFATQDAIGPAKYRRGGHLVYFLHVWILLSLWFLASWLSDSATSNGYFFLTLGLQNRLGVDLALTTVLTAVYESEATIKMAQGELSDAAMKFVNELEMEMMVDMYNR